MVRLPPVQTSFGALFVLATLASPAAATHERPLLPGRVWAPTVGAKQAGVVRRGVRLRLGAYPLRVRGGWGLEVEVRAESVDGRTHGLPAQPLLFSGSIQSHCAPRRCGTSGFGEGRISSGHTFWATRVGPRRPITEMRPYPGAGRKAIRPGQTLTLSVDVHTYGLVGRVVLDVPRRGKPRVVVLPVP